MDLDSSSSSSSSSSDSVVEAFLPSRHFFFSSPDLVSFLARFLSVDELLLCSSLSLALHAHFDHNAVWRHRLLQARHVQSSFVPLEIQPPYVEKPEDDGEEKTADASAAPLVARIVHERSRVPVALRRVRRVAGLCG